MPSIYYRKQNHQALPVAVIDIDDTLGEVHELVLNWARVFYNDATLEFDLEDYSFKTLLETLEIGLDQFHLDLKHSNLIGDFTFFEKTNLLLTGLTDGTLVGQRHHVALVTKRKHFWVNAFDTTLHQLLKQDIHFDELVVMPFLECKIDFAQEAYGDLLSMIIEDSVPAIVKSISRGIRTYIVEQPYTVNLSSPNRVCVQSGYIIDSGIRSQF